MPPPAVEMPDAAPALALLPDAGRQRPTAALFYVGLSAAACARARTNQRQGARGTTLTLRHAVLAGRTPAPWQPPSHRRRRGHARPRLALRLPADEELSHRRASKTNRARPTRQVRWLAPLMRATLTISAWRTDPGVHTGSPGGCGLAGRTGACCAQLLRKPRCRCT